MLFGKSAIITWLWVNKWHKVYGKISIMAMGNSVHNGYGKIRGIIIVLLLPLYQILTAFNKQVENYVRGFK
jgi:hypothetical protein